VDSGERAWPFTDRDANARRSASLKRHHAREREKLRVSRRVLRQLPQMVRRGDYPECVRWAVQDMERDLEAWVAGFGGPDRVSERKLSTLGAASMVNAILKLESVRYFQSQDPDSAQRVGSLASTLGRLLAVVGLDDVRAEVSLDEYLRQRTEVAVGHDAVQHESGCSERDRDSNRGDGAVPENEGEAGGCSASQEDQGAAAGK
jgi:hypothetical protein